MVEPIGRKSAKIAIKNLKLNLEFREKLVLLELKRLKDLQEKLNKFEEDRKTEFLNYIISIFMDVYFSISDYILSKVAYLNVIESYLTELDETFNELLEDAKRRAEEKIKEMPERRIPAVV